VQGEPQREEADLPPRATYVTCSKLAHWSSVHKAYS